MHRSKIIVVTHNAEGAVGKRQPLNLPVVGFEPVDVVSRLDEPWRNIGLAGVECMPEALYGFSGEWLGPEDTDEFGEVPADQRIDLAEGRLCALIDCHKAKGGIDDIDSERSVLHH